MYLSPMNCWPKIETEANIIRARKQREPETEKNKIKLLKPAEEEKRKPSPLGEISFQNPPPGKMIRKHVVCNDSSF